MNFPDKIAELLFYEFTGYVFDRVGGIFRSFHIKGWRGSSELDACYVFLGVSLQLIYVLGLLACADYENASSKRIECASMAYLELLDTKTVREFTTYLCHYIERCPAVGLVEYKYFAFLRVQDDL